jgi:glycosidase
MAWYDEAIFYHIYPLGLCGAPKENSYGEVVHRLNSLIPWIEHIKSIGCNALYIGPLFESVGHGYETTDYKKLDSRLGDNEDLKNFVTECHRQGVKVIFDGVFNHTGRDFFAFKDIKEKRESSQYKDWYCNVNFWGNNEYNDGFSYDNWGGYNLLVKLNQKNPAVKDYICDVVRFWVSEFDVDGIRLDAADVLDFDFMKALRQVANEVKPEFWLMGEVIHGEYSRWVNEGTLHSVTNYHLHKALYSGHNDHNYFEIAHTVKRLNDMGGNNPHFKLYNFVDNHDVERIYTKLNNKAHFAPVHILLYTLPGVPSIYYGSEFGIEGKKEKNSDDSLRPAINLDDYKDALENNQCTKIVAALGHIRQKSKALSYGDYKELLLRNMQYAFSRNYNGECVVVTVNNDESDYVMTLPVSGDAKMYVGALSGHHVDVVNGNICVNVKANKGDVWVPVHDGDADIKPVETVTVETVPVVDKAITIDTASGLVTETVVTEDIKVADTPATAPAATEASTVEEKKDEPATDLAYDEAFNKGKIAGLQEAIIAIMEKNGNVTDQMRRDVYDNVYHDSLITWIKSFR